MPLHDHFRRPAVSRAPWSSVCTYWIAYLGEWLDAALPTERYQSLATTHLGVAAEADLAEYELPTPTGPTGTSSDGNVAVLESPIATAAAGFETAIPDEFAIRVHDVRDDMRLVAAVEFVSPANKDRPAERAQFVSKCLGYLSSGVGLVLIDIVTTRTTNLNNELMTLLGGPPSSLMTDSPTYVVGYRSTPRQDRFFLENWPYPVRVGERIPSAPLVLKGGPTVQLDLESAYLRAAARHRL